MSQGKRIVLASRPVGEPKPSDFRLEECPVPTPGAGEVLLRTVWLSLDPYIGWRMNAGKSCDVKPVEIGSVMEGGTVSLGLASCFHAILISPRVISCCPTPVWQTHAVSDGAGVAKSIRR